MSMTTTYVEAIAEALKKNTGVKDLKETVQALGAAAEKKGKRYPDQIVLTGFMAGAFVAFGGYLMLLTGGNLGPDYPDGIKKLISGFVFPIGIILVVYCGTDLFTGNTLILPLGNLLKMVNFFYTLYVWIVCYFGNVLGAVFVSYFFVYLLYDPEKDAEKYWVQSAIKIAEAKMNKSWLQLIISGIAANWMVCSSVFIGARSRAGAGKILALWWPIFAFVCMGFEHCIANCFFLPLGVMLGANGGYWMFHNLFFSTIGNIIGGTGFTAFILWYNVQGHLVWKTCISDMFSQGKTPDVEKGTDVEKGAKKEEELDDYSESDKTSDDETTGSSVTTDTPMETSENE